MTLSQMRHTIKQDHQLWREWLKEEAVKESEKKTTILLAQIVPGDEEHDDSAYPVDEDEREPSDEFTFAVALDLMETSKDILAKVDKFLDARNISLPSDYDHILQQHMMDLGMFVAQFDGRKKEQAHSQAIISTGCKSRHHRRCDLVNCSCECHKDEDGV